jgi:Protein of unknown function (DUF475)
MVRSKTRDRRGSYRDLEHGASYAIIALAVMMFLGAIKHIPEVITGLIGGVFIAAAFLDSIRLNGANEASKATEFAPAPDPFASFRRCMPATNCEARWPKNKLKATSARGL